MLAYHPMFDPYHCSLRLMCILYDSNRPSLEWDRLRLLDFFVTFPHQLAQMKLPAEFRNRRKMLSAIPEPYETLPSPARLFFQLGEIQEAAARVLAVKEFIDGDELLKGTAAISKSAVMQPLMQIGDRLQYRSTSWYEFVVKDLSEIALQGSKGLKERSGVMEFRHDPI